MDLFFTYFEKPHICTRLNESELKVANELNEELKVTIDGLSNVAFLVKDRKALLAGVNVGNEETIVQIDIRNFFYSVDHNMLLAIVNSIAPNIVSTLEGLLKELDRSLQNEEIIREKNIKPKCGLVLGHEVFFRLAKVYLHSIDNILNESQKVERYYRFIDDILVVTESPEEIINLLESELNKLALEVNYEKLLVTPPRKDFTYLRQKFSRVG